MTKKTKQNKTPPPLNPYLMPYTKLNSSQVTELNIRAKTTELIEKDIREFLCDFDICKDFLESTHKTFTRKEKNINKLDFTKIKVQWSSKTLLRERKQATDWEKLFITPILVKILNQNI